MMQGRVSRDRNRGTTLFSLSERTELVTALSGLPARFYLAEHDRLGRSFESSGVISSFIATLQLYYRFIPNTRYTQLRIDEY